MRGKPCAASSPRFKAFVLLATSVSITRTGAPKPRATDAVSSVHPLHTTTTSSSPGWAPPVIALKVRAITELSLCAGMMTVIIRLFSRPGCPVERARTQHPLSLGRIKLFDHATWVTGNHGIRRYAAAHHRIRPDHRVSSDHQFALATDNGCSKTNPAALLDADRPASRDSLTLDGDIHIFKGMVVIHDQYRGGKDNIPLEMNPVPGGNHAAPPDFATLVELDHRLTAVRGNWNVDPHIAVEQNRITDLDVGGNRSFQVTRIMNTEVAAYRCEGIRPQHP